MSKSRHAEPEAPDGFTDLRPDGAIARRLPASVLPYYQLMRLDRPIGTWLLLFPGWWAIALAAPPGQLPDGVLLLLFGVGAVVMRAAGCVINDLFDRDIDREVERTRGRPLASGRIGLRAALVFLAGLLTIGLVILLSLPPLAIALGVASLLLVVPYPLMKRITWWPQLFLGLTFNWGALLGWAAATNDLSAAAMALYVGGIFWTLGYDTIYGYQDIEDDARVGVKSASRRLGYDRAKPFVGVSYALATLCWAVAFVLAGVGPAALLFGLLAALGLAGQVWAWKPRDPADCLRQFKANRTVGAALFVAAVLGSSLS